MKAFAENDFAEFWIKGGILYFVYKQKVEIDLKAAKKIVEDRLNLQDGIPYSVFCDFRGAKSVSKEARDYLAKEGSILLQSVAVLVESPVTRIIANFYLRINQPKVPTRMFTQKENAVKYLEEYGKEMA